jgi:hypothetical protein
MSGVNFETFTRRAERILAGVPPEFLHGIVGVEVHRERRQHPQVPDYFTLGECADDPVTRLGDPGEMKSTIHLYHGSFLALSRQDPEFDWEGELSETILHEIRHHIEDRAGIDDLRDEDAEQEALARFHADQDLPEHWYRAGERMEEGLWRVGDDLFLELALRTADLERLAGETIDLTVLDEPFELTLPEDLEVGEILSFDEEGLEGEAGRAGALHVVVTGG